MLSTSRSLRSAAESSSLTLRPSKEVMKVGNWVDFLPRDISLEILQKVGTIDKLMNIQKVSISWGNQLSSLRLVKCLNLFNEGLIEAVKKLPYLEELHIYYGKITYVGLELVGRNCPGLKSYNIQGMFPPVYFDYDDDDGHDSSNEAFAIVRSMPELRHLSLFGNQMYNNGLEAILDSCPHLESLDLRQCYRIDLEECEELSKRCFSIKGFCPLMTLPMIMNLTHQYGEIIHIGNEGYFYIGGEDDYHTENYGKYWINDFLGANVSRAAEELLFYNTSRL
ncbi:putative F-box/LRR-repeat protein 23 [Impatiens glandulifera]|uniref:putative F-box/LRR-repeat protein 23 n=1 Tax=Impatiens glandulifera TaxID=253017 RepID=UPI001FB0F395|nr:putative F-box/LRR-repeat protein 23 [Impatiens glandulifera]